MPRSSTWTVTALSATYPASLTRCATGSCGASSAALIHALVADAFQATGARLNPRSSVRRTQLASATAAAGSWSLPGFSAPSAAPRAQFR